MVLFWSEEDQDCGFRVFGRSSKPTSTRKKGEWDVGQEGEQDVGCEGGAPTLGAVIGSRLVDGGEEFLESGVDAGDAFVDDGDLLLGFGNAGGVGDDLESIANVMV